MGEQVERRQYPRKPLQKQVFCYVEGQRLDAETADISARGALIRTVWTDSANGEALVSVSFRSREPEVRDVFLFGRVERVQEGPTRGFALSWVRAVTTGPRVGLVTLLRDVLSVPEDLIEGQRLAPDGKPCKVFHFDGLDARKEAAAVRPATVPGLREPRVPTSEHDWKRYPTRGPLTRTLEATTDREPITLKALLVSGETRRNVRITSLGQVSLALDLKGNLEGIGETATVRFNVPLRRGVGLVAVTGRVTRSATRPAEGIALLELSIDSLDEADRPGVLERYLRWLRQRTLGATPETAPLPPDAPGPSEAEGTEADGIEPGAGT